MKRFIGWLLLVQLVGLIAAIVNIFHSIGHGNASGIIGRLALWPIFIQPAWLGLLASIAALLALTAVSSAIRAPGASQGAESDKGANS